MNLFFMITYSADIEKYLSKNTKIHDNFEKQSENKAVSTGNKGVYNPGKPIVF